MLYRTLTVYPTPQATSHFSKAQKSKTHVPALYDTHSRKEENFLLEKGEKEKKK